MQIEREPDGSADLVARAREGDYSAFEELVKRHQARVYAVALGITKNAAEAEEVSQETFLSAFEHLDGFRGEAKFSSWLFRVATNHALMRLRKKRPEPQGDIAALEPRMTNDGTSPFAPLSQWAKRPDDAASSKEVQQALDASLDALPTEDRAMLLLRSVDGTSHQELATIFSTTVPAVKSRLHRARLSLRALLDERLTGVLP
jgi:RNA polymerase sigma-70 factor (ECF subfamily)